MGAVWSNYVQKVLIKGETEGSGILGCPEITEGHRKRK